MLDHKLEKDFEILAAEIRLETFRALAALGFGHVGGAMSIAEALAVLYGGEMRINPQRPDWEERDYFALSKGHAGPALYATLAVCFGCIGRRAWTLFVQQQDPAGRLADVLIAGFFACIIAGLWPLLP